MVNNFPGFFDLYLIMLRILKKSVKLTALDFCRNSSLTGFHDYAAEQGLLNLSAIKIRRSENIVVVLEYLSILLLILIGVGMIAGILL